MTFLFWNLMKQPLAERIARLAVAHDVDFLLLAECAEPASALLPTLNEVARTPFAVPFSVNNKFRVLTRYTDSRVVEKSNTNGNRMSIREVRRPGGDDLLLGIIHLPSQVNWSEDDLDHQAARCVRDVIHVEREVGHRRTMLIGDFNMNPFSKGIVSSHGFHAMMTRDAADDRGRVVLGERYDFFYNPMWSVFGDRTPGPPGTYYLHASKPVNYSWNMYDQVLVRPALKDALAEICILDHDGESSLLTRTGCPDFRNASDHLPLLVRLDLERLR